ncbi:ATP-binding cassette domain-containing protein [Caballeronia sp. DA-9]|uniref:ATP-binding cassette domain-containing protein n=1 Tax=Caballeronia sp. DA-9 TaxID=3436237 RepID=UPI003F66E318
MFRTSSSVESGASTRPVPPSSASATPKEWPVIEISGLTKRCGKSLVLDGVDLNVQRGEVVAVSGRSGGGKTTMLRSINLLEMPDSGIVRAACMSCSMVRKPPHAVR